MIVWGCNYFNTGGGTTPSTETWTPTATGVNCPSGRRDHTAVWTGTEMIVWEAADQAVIQRWVGATIPQTIHGLQLH